MYTDMSSGVDVCTKNTWLRPFLRERTQHNYDDHPNYAN